MNATNCLANIDINSFKCQVSCKGSLALIEFVDEKEDKKELAPLQELIDRLTSGSAPE